MQKRAIVTAVVFLVGCRSTYDVPVRSASAIHPGWRVPLIRGELELREPYEVRALPFPNAVFVSSPERPWVFTVAPAFKVPAGQPSYSATPWLQNPIDVVRDGPTLMLVGNSAAGIQKVPLSSVSSIELRQASPGKTAGVILGVGLPALLVATLAIVIANQLSHASWGGLGY